MRYLKVPGITVRIPLQSIESADYIMTTWKDYEKAFDNTADRFRAKLERLSNWGHKEIEGKRTVHFIKIKVVDFWVPLKENEVCSSSMELLDT